MKQFFITFMMGAAMCATIATTSCKPEGTTTPDTEFTIALTAENGTAKAFLNDAEVTKAKAGDLVEVRAVANTDYDFTGWSATPTVEFAIANSPTTTFTMPAANVAITAAFTKEKYAVNFTATYEGQGTVAVTVDNEPVAGGGLVEVGSTVTLTATPESGYLFTEWGGIQLADKTALTQTFTMPANSVTITAGWEVAGQILNFPNDATGGWVEVSVDGSYINSGTKVPAGSEVEVEAVALFRYKFINMNITGVASFTEADKTKSSFSFSMPDNEVSIEVSFEQMTAFPITWVVWDTNAWGPMADGHSNTIEVRADKNGNGTHTDDEDIITQGEEIPAGITLWLKAIPDANSKFDYWMSNDGREFIPTGSASNMTGADQLEVSFEFTQAWTKSNAFKICPLFSAK